MGIVINDIAIGDVFSEDSHYVVTKRSATGVSFKQLETGIEVNLDNKYVTDILKSADQVDKVVKVGKEDKFWTKKQIEDALKKKTIKPEDGVKVGDLASEGIRTIFENIYTGQVFTAVFQKQDTKLSKKAYEALLLEQRTQVAETLEKVASAKKGVKDAALVELEKVQLNYISDIIPGEMRTLRGYKQQFKSRDGKYACLDMDLNESRPVNIVTLQSIAFNGVKYELE